MCRLRVSQLASSYTRQHVHAPCHPANITNMANAAKRAAGSAPTGEKKSVKKQRTGGRGQNDGPKPRAGGKHDKKGVKKQRTEGNQDDATNEKKTGKDLKQARKLHKPHGEMVEQAKRLWEEIRTHNTASDKRAKLVTELCTLIAGHMHDVIFRHDAARVVQCCIQFGTPEQRQAVFDELKEHWAEMMKSIYGKFVVSKMLDYGTKEQKAQIIESMYGQVRKLIKHQEAANIVDAAFTDHANAAQRTALVQEFYAPEYAVFKAANVKTLAELIKEKPEKKSDYLKFVQETLMGVVSKGTLSFSIVHRVVREFFECADDAEKQEMAGALAEHVVGILHTRDGSLTAMHVIWNSPAKDRKTIIKSFKTHVAKIAREEYGHHVLLALFDQVDDTVLVKKSVVNELVAELADLCTEKFARLVLLYMLTPRNGRYLHPAHIATLSQGDTNPFSKKDRAVRAREVRESISGPLLHIVGQHADWAFEGKPAQIVEEALLNPEGADKEWRGAVESVLTLVDRDDCALEHPVAGLVFKRLIKSALTIDNERLGALVWGRARAHVGRIAQSKQGCYTLAALLGDDQPAELRANVAAGLEDLDLPQPDATGADGKPLPGAVLTKALVAAGAAPKAKIKAATVEKPTVKTPATQRRKGKKSA